MADYAIPVALYEFSLGSKVWRYTSNAVDVVDADGNVWESAAISDQGVSQSGEIVTDTFTITCSVDLVPARLYMYATPRSVMDIRMLSASLPDKVATPGFSGVDSSLGLQPILVSNRRVEYVGEVKQCGFDGAPGSANFTCEALGSTMDTEGLRLVWMRSCPYVVYDPLTCRLNKAAHASTTTIIDITGNWITVSPGVSGDFAGGLLEAVHPVKGPETLTIEAGGGGSFLIFDGASDLSVGQSITVYPGCNQTPARCESFGNTLNYGGIKDLPGTSPFDGLSSPSF